MHAPAPHRPRRGLAPALLATGLLAGGVAVTIALAGGPVAIAGTAHAVAGSAPGGVSFASRATGIGPGAELLTEIGPDLASCTANFVFTDGDRVFLGSAAHCHALGESLDGCVNESLPLGTPVTVGGPDGTEITAELAYSSWRTMQEVGETDRDRCELNDLALLEIDPADVGLVDPSVPAFGGPTGLDVDGVAADEVVVSFQNDEDDPPFRAMRAKQGVLLGYADEEGFGYIVQTGTPGLPGDSGSGYLDGDGRAFGVLSTEIVLTDGEIVNGVTDLAQALDYAAAHGGPDVTVVEGGVPFSAQGVPMDALPAEPIEPGQDDLRDLGDLLGRGADALDDLLGG
ncbi:MAG: trypsin-like peptidase domain-containing protein [Pseudonocardiales bacterium]|nr:trypsin-like peptidase domain-containing protein [Pseudonocardiales bacterium]